MLLQLICSRAIKNAVTLAKPRTLRICSSAHRSDTPAVKSDNEEAYQVKQPWTSYGFDYEDKKIDRHFMHAIFFSTISVLFVFGAVMIAYAPDPLLKDWSQREAYLQLRYREANGLPPIDPNIVDPSKFILPSDEELGFTEIII